MKMTPLIIVAGLIAVVVLVLVIWQVKTISGSGMQAKDTAKYEKISGIYKENCARCHGDDGQGYGDKPAIESVGYSVDKIKEIIKGGLNTMPSFPNIKEPVLTELSEYVQTL